MSRLPAPPAAPIEGQRSRPLKHSAYRTRRQAHHVPLSTSFARSAQRARNRERATRLLPVHSASVDGGGSGGNGGDHDDGGHGGDDDDDDWSARRRAIAAAPLLTRSQVPAAPSSFTSSALLDSQSCRYRISFRRRSSKYYQLGIPFIRLMLSLAAPIKYGLVPFLERPTPSLLLHRMNV
jgi:hypothetical protein